MRKLLGDEGLNSVSWENTSEGSYSLCFNAFVLEQFEAQLRVSF